MRRLVALATVTVLALGLAPTVLAGAPDHERSTSTGTFDAPAGEACDFAYHQEGAFKENFFLFGDPESPSKIVWQSQQRVVHVNVATGYTLTESAAVAETFYPGTAVDKVAGIFWHLRDADGRLVAVHAGQMVINYSGELPVVVKITPQMDADFFGVICTALGGHPA